MPIAAAPLRDLWFLPLIGLVAGLWLFVRGLLAYRIGTRVETIATSPVAGLAAGEVRVSGTVEAGSTLLVSRLQSASCVYYHARVVEDRGRSSQTVLDDARAVSFVLRDASGTVHVFPRGARWILEHRLDERAGLGEEPPSLDPNEGPAMELAPADREAQIARLLTVRGADDEGASLFARTVPSDAPIVPMAGVLGGGGGVLGGAGGVLGDLEAGDGFAVGAGRHYVEERVEPGDTITIVGTALPFGELGDGATDVDQPALDDPEIAADIVAASASGSLRADAADAWGNAAIPGFGIGQPTRPPVGDPGTSPQPRTPDPALAALRQQGRNPSPSIATPTPGLAIAAGELVIATGSTPMTVLAGTPSEAVARESSRFWTGLAGAVLAVGSAVALLLLLGGAR